MASKGRDNQVQSLSVELKAILNEQLTNQSVKRLVKILNQLTPRQTTIALKAVIDDSQFQSTIAKMKTAIRSLLNDSSLNGSRKGAKKAYSKISDYANNYKDILRDVNRNRPSLPKKEFEIIKRSLSGASNDQIRELLNHHVFGKTQSGINELTKEVKNRLGRTPRGTNDYKELKSLYDEIGKQDYNKQKQFQQKHDKEVAKNAAEKRKAHQKRLKEQEKKEKEEAAAAEKQAKQDRANRIRAAKENEALNRLIAKEETAKRHTKQLFDNNYQSPVSNKAWALGKKTVLQSQNIGTFERLYANSKFGSTEKGLKLLGNTVSDRMKSVAPNTAEYQRWNALLEEIKKKYDAITGKAQNVKNETKQQNNLLARQETRRLSYQLYGKGYQGSVSDEAWNFGKKRLQDGGINLFEGAFNYSKFGSTEKGLGILRSMTRDKMAGMQTGTAEYKRWADLLSQIEQRYAKVNTKAQRHQKILAETRNTANWLSQHIRDYFSIFAAESFLKKLISITTEFEMQRIAIGALINDQNEAFVMFERIKSMAIKSPFSTLEISKNVKQLAAYNVDKKDLLHDAKMLGDISASTGADMGRLTLAYGQVKAAEFLRGPEARQFTEAGVPIIDALAKRYSVLEGHLVTMGEVYDRISKRQVSFKDVAESLARMTEEGGKFYNMQEKMVETNWGQLRRLKDITEQQLASLGQSTSGVINMSIKLVTKLAKNIRHMLVASLIMISGVVLKKVVQAFAALRISILQVRTTSKSTFLELYKATYKAKGQVTGLSRSFRIAKLSVKSFGVALKSVFGFGMLTGITTIIGAIAGIVSKTRGAKQELKQMRYDLRDMDEQTESDNEAVDNNFKKWADEAVRAEKGSERQQRALAKLAEAYGDILSPQDLSIENLEKMRGNYDALTNAIKRHNNIKKDEKKLEYLKEKIDDGKKEKLEEKYSKMIAAAYRKQWETQRRVEKEKELGRKLNDREAYSISESYNGRQKEEDDKKARELAGKVVPKLIENNFNYNKVADFLNNETGLNFNTDSIRLGGKNALKGLWDELEIITEYASMVENYGEAGAKLMLGWGDKIKEFNEEWDNLRGDDNGLNFIETKTKAIGEEFASLLKRFGEVKISSKEVSRIFKEMGNIKTINIIDKDDMEQTKEITEQEQALVKAIVATTLQEAQQMSLIKEDSREIYENLVKQNIERNKAVSLTEELKKEALKVVGTNDANIKKDIGTMTQPIDFNVGTEEENNRAKKGWSYVQKVGGVLEQAKKGNITSDAAFKQIDKIMSDYLSAFNEYIEKNESGKVVSKKGYNSKNLIDFYNKMQTARDYMTLSYSIDNKDKKGSAPNYGTAASTLADIRKREVELRGSLSLPAAHTQLFTEYGDVLKELNKDYPKLLSSLQAVGGGKFYDKDKGFDISLFYDENRELLDKWIKELSKQGKNAADRLNIANQAIALDQQDADKAIKDILNVFERAISQIKSKVNLYDALFKATGNNRLSKSIAESFYGKDMKLQDLVKTRFKEIADNKNLSDDFKNHAKEIEEMLDNGKSFAEIVSKLNDPKNFPTEQAEKLLKLVNEIRQQSETTIKNILNSYKQFQSYGMKYNQILMETKKMREDLDEEFKNKRISEEDKRELEAVINQQELQKIKNLELENIKAGELWINTFNNIEQAGKSSLIALREQLMKFRKENAALLDPTQLKEITKHITDINKALKPKMYGWKNGLKFSLGKTDYTELNNLYKGRETLLQERDKKQKELEETYNDASLDDNSKQKKINGLQQGIDIDNIALSQIEDKINEITEEIDNSIEGLTEAIDYASGVINTWTNAVAGVNNLFEAAYSIVSRGFSIHGGSYSQDELLMFQKVGYITEGVVNVAKTITDSAKNWVEMTKRKEEAERKITEEEYRKLQQVNMDEMIEASIANINALNANTISNYEVARSNREKQGGGKQGDTQPQNIDDLKQVITREDISKQVNNALSKAQQKDDKDKKGDGGDNPKNKKKIEFTKGQEKALGYIAAAGAGVDALATLTDANASTGSKIGAAGSALSALGTATGNAGMMLAGSLVSVAGQVTDTIIKINNAVYDTGIKKLKNSLEDLQDDMKGIDNEMKNLAGNEYFDAMGRKTENLRKQYENAQKQLELEKKKTKPDEDEVKSYEKAVKDSYQALIEQQQQMFEYMLGTDIKGYLEGIVKTFVDARNQGVNTFKALKESFGEMVSGMIEKTIMSSVIKKRFENLFAQITEMAEKGEMTAADINALIPQGLGALQLANNDLLAYYPLIKSVRNAFGKSGSSSGGRTAGVQGMTEETAGTISGYMAAQLQTLGLMQTDVAMIKMAVVGNGKVSQMGMTASAVNSEMANNYLNYLVSIEANTKATTAQLTSMNRKMDKIVGTIGIDLSGSNTPVYAWNTLRK